jgi:hypothetical protein
MSDADHPRVFLQAEGPGPMSIAYGYLFIVDGVPWLARTLEDARALQFQLRLIRSFLKNSQRLGLLIGIFSTVAA